MNKLGVHALVWVGGWSHEECAKAIGQTAELGFDLIEIPALDPKSIDVVFTRRTLEKNRLGVTMSLGLDAASDISSGDPDKIARGEALLMDALLGRARHWRDPCLRHPLLASRNISCPRRKRASPARSTPSAGSAPRRRRATSPSAWKWSTATRATSLTPRPRRSISASGWADQRQGTPRHLSHAHRGGRHRGGDRADRRAARLFPRRRIQPRLSRRWLDRLRQDLPRPGQGRLSRPDHVRILLLGGGNHRCPAFSRSGATYGPMAATSAATPRPSWRRTSRRRRKRMRGAGGVG